jgi:TatD DNase family protein
MSIPQPGDFIDIHTHGANPVTGVFSVENLIPHEARIPSDIKGLAFTFGIHPWYVNERNHISLIKTVKEIAGNPFLLAIGEAGFDKLRGPSLELQKIVFEEQASIAEINKKPVFIHCVRAWDELIAAHKNIKPGMPWLIHGFRGSLQLAEQLLSRGMYLSFWFDFILRPESADLLRAVPRERIFLETDGAEADIKDIYYKVSADLNITSDELKNIIYSNYINIFTSKNE